MRRLSMVLLALALAAGCSKKENKTDKPAGSGSADTMKTDPGSGSSDLKADPGSGSAGSGDMAGSAGSANSAGSGGGGGTLAELKAPQAGLPKDCTSAFEQMKKVHDCDKIDMKMRETLTKAWNDAVELTFGEYSKASDKNKKTIAGTCTSMIATAGQLAKECQ